MALFSCRDNGIHQSVKAWMAEKHLADPHRNFPSFDGPRTRPAVNGRIRRNNMSEAPESAPEGENTPSSSEPEKGNEPKAFTQEEVDKLIGKTRTEERRKAHTEVATKYADYDDLKKAAEGKKTADDRIAELEKKYQQSEANTLRLRVAGEYGISTKRGEDGEPSDADLFLTGTDEETLSAQAKRLADRVAAQAAAEVDRKKKSPTVPKEGTSTQTGTTTEEEGREFARSFFGGSS